MLILPFIPFSGKAWAFFLCSLAIGHHCSTLPSPVEEKWKPTDPVVSSTFQSKISSKAPNKIGGTFCWKLFIAL
jgi:hypothetical protein